MNIIYDTMEKQIPEMEVVKDENQMQQESAPKKEVDYYKVNMEKLQEVMEEKNTLLKGIILKEIEDVLNKIIEPVFKN